MTFDNSYHKAFYSDGQLRAGFYCMDGQGRISKTRTEESHYIHLYAENAQLSQAQIDAKIQNIQRRNLSNLSIAPKSSLERSFEQVHPDDCGLLVTFLEKITFPKDINVSASLFVIVAQRLRKYSPDIQQKLRPLLSTHPRAIPKILNLYDNGNEGIANVLIKHKMFNLSFLKTLDLKKKIPEFEQIANQIIQLFIEQPEERIQEMLAYVLTFPTVLQEPRFALLKLILKHIPSAISGMSYIACLEKNPDFLIKHPHVITDESLYERSEYDRLKYDLVGLASGDGESRAKASVLLATKQDEGVRHFLFSDQELKRFVFFDIYKNHYKEVLEVIKRKGYHCNIALLGPTLKKMGLPTQKFEEMCEKNWDDFSCYGYFLHKEHSVSYHRLMLWAIKFDPQAKVDCFHPYYPTFVKAVKYLLDHPHKAEIFLDMTERNPKATKKLLEANIDFSCLADWQVGFIEAALREPHITVADLKQLLDFVTKHSASACHRLLELQKSNPELFYIILKTPASTETMTWIVNFALTHPVIHKEIGHLLTREVVYKNIEKTIDIDQLPRLVGNFPGNVVEAFQIFSRNPLLLGGYLGQLGVWNIQSVVNYYRRDYAREPNRVRKIIDNVGRLVAAKQYDVVRPVLKLLDAGHIVRAEKALDLSLELQKDQALKVLADIVESRLINKPFPDQLSQLEQLMVLKKCHEPGLVAFCKTAIETNPESAVFLLAKVLALVNAGKAARIRIYQWDEINGHFANYQQTIFQKFNKLYFSRSRQDQLSSVLATALSEMLVLDNRQLNLGLCQVLRLDKRFAEINPRIPAVLAELETNGEMTKIIESIQRKVSFPPLLNEFLQGIWGVESITDVHLQKTVVSALFYDLRQTDVGSCATTCSTTQIQSRHPILMLRDMKQIVETGEIKRHNKPYPLIFPSYKPYDNPFLVLWDYTVYNLTANDSDMRSHYIRLVRSLIKGIVGKLDKQQKQAITDLIIKKMNQHFFYSLNPELTVQHSIDGRSSKGTFILHYKNLLSGTVHEILNENTFVNYFCVMLTDLREEVTSEQRNGIYQTASGITHLIDKLQFKTKKIDKFSRCEHSNHEGATKRECEKQKRYLTMNGNYQFAFTHQYFENKNYLGEKLTIPIEGRVIEYLNDLQNSFGERPFVAIEQKGHMAAPLIAPSFKELEERSFQLRDELIKPYLQSLTLPDSFEKSVPGETIGSFFERLETYLIMRGIAPTESDQPYAISHEIIRVENELLTNEDIRLKVAETIAPFIDTNWATMGIKMYMGFGKRLATNGFGLYKFSEDKQVIVSFSFLEWFTIFCGQFTVE